uniref:Uncharacterized protein n=1 Tax=Parascaris equorum TaxID=6256 RepID=A0A914RQ67_PAREQ
MILRRDPCGVLCALLTYAAMIYADYVVINWLVAPTFSQRWASLKQSHLLEFEAYLAFNSHISLLLLRLWGVTHVILFNTVLFLAFIAHFRAMVTDPGIVPINANATIGSCRRLDPRLYGRSAVSESENDESDSGADVMMLKPKVKIGRSVRAVNPIGRHVRITVVFVGVAFARWTIIKYFLQFLLYVGLSSSYALGLVVAAWVYHDDRDSVGINGLYGQNARHARMYPF